MSKAVQRRKRGKAGERVTVPVSEERRQVKTKPRAAASRTSRYASGGKDTAAEFSVVEGRWADVAPELSADLACWVAPPIVVSVRAAG